MDIYGFSAALIRRIERLAPNSALRNEANFERRHVVVPAWELSRKHSDVRVFTHPGKRTTKCTSACAAGVSDFSLRVEGCPDCWAASKGWSVADAFGIRNNFDLVAIDQNEQTLAVEVKWLSLDRKSLNSEFQWFIGQCTLAAAANHVVVGVCGFRGQRKKHFDEHEAELKSKLRKIGVFLVALRAEL